MKRMAVIAAIIGLFMMGCIPTSAQEKTEVVRLDPGIRINSFDTGWLFSFGEKEGGDAALQDRGWQKLSLPHDWSIAMEYDASLEAESGYLPGGVGWYRKKFIVPRQMGNKRISIMFDGVYQRADVYLNGQWLGYHPDGYTSFSLDLSDALKADDRSENVLAVRVENPQPNSRWYSGSGIYRDVWLKVTDPVFIDEDATSIHYDADSLLQTNGTVTKAEIAVCNSGSSKETVLVQSVLKDPDGVCIGKTVSQITLSPGDNTSVAQQIEAKNLRLWSTQDPVQYTWDIAISSSAMSDAVSIPFGYRSIGWDANHGFFLNGKGMKLQGVCLHQDYGALGTACYEAVVRRQLDKLKQMGVNAIRSTHHPSGPVLRRLCAEKGFLLIEEGFDTYCYAKNGNLNDGSSFFLETVGADNGIEHAKGDETWAEYTTRRMVQQARNNPAVILYSIGNELLGNIGGNPSEYPVYAKNIVSWIQEEDPDAIVTIGDNMAGKENVIQNAMDQELVDAGGAVGLNYASADVYDAMHESYPTWCLYGSETASAFSSRGWYSSAGIDEENLQVSAYDQAHVDWGSTAETAWKDVVSRDYLGGEFIWTGWDYLGEPEPWNDLEPGEVTGRGPRPKSSYFGVVDTAGFEKDSYYFYMSQWNPSVTTLHILPHWNGKDLKKDSFGRVKVAVYSNAASVELFRNGRSLGRKYFTKEMTPDGYTYQTCQGRLYLVWEVWYWPGQLSARAYDEDGRLITDTVGRNVVTTSAQPAKIVLSAEQNSMCANGKDLAFITAEIQDAKGNPVYGAEEELSFTLEGEGKIIGVDNGDPTDLSSYKGSDDTHAHRRTFSGKALIIVQSTTASGTLTLHARGKDIADGVIQLSAACANP